MASQSFDHENFKVCKLMLRIAAYQAAAPAKSIEGQLEVIKRVLQSADGKGIDIVCFPEGFLTGYYSDRETAQLRSLECKGALFSKVLAELAPFSAAAILGFNERFEGNLFNSVAVIEQGTLCGIQRKHFLYHNYFTAGEVFAPISVKGVSIGVLVCLDSNYLEPARILALQGAQVFFVPMCNRVALDHRFVKRPAHYSHFIARAYENRCWVAAADWAYPSDGETVSVGHSCIYSPNGEEIKRSEESKEQLLVADIPMEHLSTPVTARVMGSEKVNAQLAALMLGLKTSV